MMDSKENHCMATAGKAGKGKTKSTAAAGAGRKTTGKKSTAKK
jgi:hypothetical protein